MEKTKQQKETFIKSAIIVFLLITVVVTEALTREAVFKFSLIFEKKLQSVNSESLTLFFKIISEIGKEYFYLPVLILLYLFYPLTKSLTYLFNLGISIVLVEILKNSYGNPRPFWIDTNLFKVCEGGYGNPSGHSIASVAGFLGLWSTLFDVEYFDDKPFWKFSALFFHIFIIINIIFSRLFLAAHSLNQVIYGASLGLCVWLFLYVIFKLHKSSSINFFMFFIKKANQIAVSIIFALLITVMLLIYFLKQNEYLAYEKIFQTLCKGVTQYKKFNNSGLYGGLVIFSLIGAYYGVMLMLYLICKKHEIEPEAAEEEFPVYIKYTKLMNSFDSINNWNKTSWKNWFLIVFIDIAFCIPGILKVTISSNASLPVIFIFKTCLPFLFVSFGLYGFSIYFAIYYKLANNSFKDTGENNSNNNINLENIEFKKVEFNLKV